MPGVNLKVVDKAGNQVEPGEIGEIIANGDNLMRGYWNQPEKTEEVIRSGWLYTGDLAKVDEEGYIYIVGRNSEMIKSAGARISPKEIEEVVLEIPEITECGVVGLKDEILGEAITACVVLKKDKIISEDQVMEHCAERLPSYKVPHHVKFVSNLPKTASGKIKRVELKKMIEAHRE